MSAFRSRSGAKRTSSRRHSPVTSRRLPPVAVLRALAFATSVSRKSSVISLQRARASRLCLRERDVKTCLVILKRCVTNFSGRIQSLARVHTMLSTAEWKGVDLHDLVRDQLLAGAVDETRITAWGPAVHLESQLALHAALMLHELGTNAIKYGALSTAKGIVIVQEAKPLKSWSTRRTSWRPRTRAKQASKLRIFPTITTYPNADTGLLRPLIGGASLATTFGTRRVVSLRRSVCPSALSWWAIAGMPDRDDGFRLL